MVQHLIASRAVGLADLYRGTPTEQRQASLLDVTREVVGIHGRLIVQAALPFSARSDTSQAELLVAVARENSALIGVHVAHMPALSLGYNPAQVHGASIETKRRALSGHRGI